MSDYPEHDKLSAVKDETQAAGEFAEWLGAKGIHLMVWREDLTDVRTPEMDWCKSWRTEHCIHFAADPKHDCCHCGRDHELREITGLKAWTAAPGLYALLAEWAGIDQDKIETEKRQMLATLRAQNGG